MARPRTTFPLRLPEDLLSLLKQEAAASGRSLTAQIEHILRHREMHQLAPIDAPVTAAPEVLFEVSVTDVTGQRQVMRGRQYAVRLVREAPLPTPRAPQERADA